MRRISTIGAFIIASGAIVFVWCLRSGKSPRQWDWLSPLGSHAPKDANPPALTSSTAESIGALSRGHGQEGKPEDRRNADQKRPTPSLAQPGRFGPGMAARSNALSGASAANGRIPLVSGPTTLVAIVTEQTKRTLGLFSKIVPVDDDTQEKLVDADTNLAQAYADIRQLVAANNLSSTDRQKLFGQQYDDYRQTVIDILGPQNGPTYIALNDADRFSPIVNGFAAQCAAAGDPLTPAAQVSVTINLATNLEDPANPRKPLILPNGVPYSQQQAFDAAGKVLTPTQLSIFKQLWAAHPYPNTGAH